ncbi:hypothetical protein R6Q57_016736 [Mikania cordata]
MKSLSSKEDGSNPDSIDNEIQRLTIEATAFDQPRFSRSADAFQTTRTAFQVTMDDEWMRDLPEFSSFNNISQINDTFLSLLCYDNESEKDDEVNYIEDWTENENDDDSDGVGNTEANFLYPSYDPPIDWRFTKHILGMKFESPTGLKKSSIDSGVSNGHQLEFIVNDYCNLLVVCEKAESGDEEDSVGKKKKVRKCPFRLWASRLTCEDSFQIKTLNEKNMCTRKYSLGSLVTFS